MKLNDPTLLAERSTVGETFGPLALDVVAQANATEYGPAPYFYAPDPGRVFAGIVR